MSQRASGPSSTERVSGVAQATVLTASASTGRGSSGPWWAAGLVLAGLTVAAAALGSRMLQQRVLATLQPLFDGWGQQQRSMGDLAGRLAGVGRQLEQWAALDSAGETGDASGVLVISRGQAAELAGQIRALASEAESLQRAAVQRQSLVAGSTEAVRRDTVAVLWAALAGLWVAQAAAGLWLARGSLRPLGRLRRDLEMADQSLQALASALPRWFSRVAEGVAQARQRVDEGQSWWEAHQTRIEAGTAAVARLQEGARRVGACATRFGALAERLRDLGGESRLLGLSAAIEAARMEHQGRAVAVVAEEVRRLARESREVVHELGQLQQEVEQAAEQAVRAAQEATQELETLGEAAQAGRRAASAVGEELERLHGRLAAASRAAAGTVRVSALRGTYDLRASVDRALGPVPAPAAPESGLWEAAAAGETEPGGGSGPAPVSSRPAG